MGIAGQAVTISKLCKEANRKPDKPACRCNDPRVTGNTPVETTANYRQFPKTINMPNYKYQRDSVMKLSVYGGYGTGPQARLNLEAFFEPLRMPVS